MTTTFRVLLALLIATLFLIPPVSTATGDGEDYGDPGGEGIPEDPVDENDLPDEGDAGKAKPEPVTVSANKVFLNVYKINFYDSGHGSLDLDTEPVDGQDIFINTTIENRARIDLYDINVDFYYGPEGDEYYIGTDTIPMIEGNGGTETAEVSWRAKLGEQKVKVIADPDGNSGGPGEDIANLTVYKTDHSVDLQCFYNASGIKVGEGAHYYVKITNTGKQDDTFEITYDEHYHLGASGWSVTTATTEVTLDAGETDYIRVDVSYDESNPNYNKALVVEVIATTEGGAGDYSDRVFLSNEVIHDVPILFVDDDMQHHEFAKGHYWVGAGGQYGPDTDDIIRLTLNETYGGLYHYLELPRDVVGSGGGVSSEGDCMPPYDENEATDDYNDGETTNESQSNEQICHINPDTGDPMYLKDYDVVLIDTGYISILSARGA